MEDFEPSSDIDAVEILKARCIDISRGAQSSAYSEVRDWFRARPILWDKLPSPIRNCRNPRELWAFIKPKFPSYAERDAYWVEEFRPILEGLEAADNIPGSDLLDVALVKHGADAIREAWSKGLARCAGDPDGALTAARTMIESTCKHILTDSETDFDEKADLPKLYKLTAKQLNLAPEQHTEEVFRQVLGGCTAVVEGLGAIRTKHGDAHGKTPNARKPLPIHAQLAVTLAGGMCVFLLETWALRKKRS